MTGVQLDSVVTIVGGGTPSKGRAEYYVNGTIPWVTPKDMKSWEITDAIDRITQAALEESATRLVPQDSVLLVVRSGILKHSLPVAINRVPVALNQDMKALVCDSTVFPEYLARFLQWSAPRILSQARATTADNLPIDGLRKLRLSLPPLPQQRRIAALLDKADGVRRKRQQAIRLADDLLRSAFLDMFGDIAAKASHYPMGPVGDWVNARSGKSSKNIISSVPTGIPIIGGNGPNGWATRPLYDRPVVVVGRVGQQCGITHITDGPAWVTDNAIVVEVVKRERLDPVYLATAWQHSPIRAAVERLDLPFINQEMLITFPIPLPPLERQRRFSEIRTRVLALKARQEQASATNGQLFQSLSRLAFAGEDASPVSA